MKSVLLSFLMISTTCLFGQKTYEFDYLLSYDFYWDHKTSKPTKYIYLTNSQNNEFTAALTELDSATFKLDFLDHRGNHSITKIGRDLFKTSTNIRVKCVDVKPHSNTRRGLAKRFDFSILQDTLLSGDSYGHYILKSRNKNGGAIEHYIIDTTFDRHLPILRFSTAFTRWDMDKNLPNGILFEKYLMGDDKKKRHKLILTGHTITNKSISIPADCNYSD